MNQNKSTKIIEKNCNMYGSQKDYNIWSFFPEQKKNKKNFLFDHPTHFPLNCLEKESFFSFLICTKKMIKKKIAK